MHKWGLGPCVLSCEGRGAVSERPLALAKHIKSGTVSYFRKIKDAVSKQKRMRIFILGSSLTFPLPLMTSSYMAWPSGQWNG